MSQAFKIDKYDKAIEDIETDLSVLQNDYEKNKKSTHSIELTIVLFLLIYLIILIYLTVQINILDAKMKKYIYCANTVNDESEGMSERVVENYPNDSK